MKVFPLWRVFRAQPNAFDPILIHTGQHYDRIMSDAIFRDLDLPELLNQAVADEPAAPPELEQWDGETAERIAQILNS